MGLLAGGERCGVFRAVPGCSGGVRLTPWSIYSPHAINLASTLALRGDFTPQHT